MITRFVRKRFVRKLVWLVFYPVLSKIAHLESLHAGEECYIFGDGSSIKNFELSAFADKIGIAINAFPRHRGAQQLNLRYWIVAEPGFFLPLLFRPRFKNIKGYRNRVRFQSFFRRQPRDSSDLIRISSIMNLPGLWRDRAYFFWEQLPRGSRDHKNPRTDSMFADSICAAITLAQYLGFKKAVLVGFDYTHNPGMSYHWYENTTPIAFPENPETYHREFFDMMLKHIEIVTLTPTPQSTKLPSVDYRSFTGRDLCYRENIELLAREDLEVLALYPGYKIF